MKHAVFQYFRESRKLSRDPRILTSGFLWAHLKLSNPEIIISDLRDGPGALVFVDSSVFSAESIPFVRALSETCSVIVLPEIARELADYVASPPRTVADREMARIVCDHLIGSTSFFQRPRGFRTVNSHRAAAYYGMALGIRKRAFLRIPDSPVGRQTLSQASKATSRLATKNRNDSKSVDETLTITAVFESVRQSKLVIILTNDDDIFSQGYKLVSMMMDDYLSFLVASDVVENRAIYPDAYSISTVAEVTRIAESADDAFAISTGHLGMSQWRYPKSSHAFAIASTGPRPEILFFRLPHGAGRFVNFKGIDGRNTHQFGNLNGYVKLPFRSKDLRLVPGMSRLHILRDKFDMNVGCNFPGMYLSTCDFARALVDVENPGFAFFEDSAAPRARDAFRDAPR